MRKIKNLLLLTTLIAGISTVDFAYGATLPIDMEAAAAYGVGAKKLRDLHGIVNEADYFSVFFNPEDGNAYLKANKLCHNPDEPIVLEEEAFFQLFTVSQDTYSKQFSSRIRIFQKTETEISVQYKRDLSSEEWEEARVFPGQKPEIEKVNSSIISVTYKQGDERKEDSIPHPFIPELQHRKNASNRYRIVSNEDTRSFEVRYNPTPATSEDWETIYKNEGVEAKIESSDLGKLHLSWFNKGRNVAFVNEGTIRHEPTVWNIHYSSIHPNVKVISRRTKPGLPLVYELWQDDVQTQKFDTNRTGFSDFAEVTPIYVENTIDETLSEDVPNRKPGLFIPVSLYTRGHNPSKPTLVFIKGGPYLTRHSRFNPVYQALSYHYNVVVTEYRGSGGNGKGGSITLNFNDLGGGHVRDVVSVLKAVRKGYPDFNPKDMVILGHSFGGLSLASIMQNPLYADDIKGIYCILANAELDALATGRAFGHVNEHHRLLKDSSEEDETKSDAAEVSVAGGIDGPASNDPAVQKRITDMVKCNRLKAKDNRERSPIFHTDKMPTEKTLVIASTHDGNIWVEQSLQFVIQWVENLVEVDELPPKTEALTKVGQFDACTEDFKLKAYRSFPSTRAVLEEFKVWWNAIDPVVKRRLPMDVKIIENATHSFTDSPEILGEFIRAIKNFTSISSE